MNIVDLQPLLQTALDFIVPILGLLASYATWKLGAWFTSKTGIEVDRQAHATLNTVLQRGIQMGADKLRGMGSDFAKVEVKNELIATAANFAVMQAPGTLARFDLTPQKLENMIRARLAENVPELAQPMLLTNPLPPEE